MTIRSSIAFSLTSFLRNRAGTIMVAFAVMLPVLVGATGMAMDTARIYLVRQRLGGTIDAAALAATASQTTTAGITQRVSDFFNANYPDAATGTTRDLKVSVDGDSVTVSAYADYDTTFMRILGINTVSVFRTTTVVRQVQGLEVAMVLDNTGSMATNNNISALRTAATNFVNILFDKTDDPAHLKIGIVPYANAVRIGYYGLGLQPDGKTKYDNGNKFVTLPSGVTYNSNHDASSGWYGCVIEHKNTGYSSTATMVANSRGQLWQSGSTNWSGHGWDPTKTTNDPYPYDVQDNYTGPWDIYQSGAVGSTTTNTPAGCSGSGKNKCTGTATTWAFTPASTPNVNCPYANILPLTSTQKTLLSTISSMQAHGDTLGNIGMAWGYRLLSPERPFTEGSDWNDKNWRKAVIIMTDGENTRDGTYSTFWMDPKNSLSTTIYNNRFLEVCNALKAKNVLIYAVTFYSGVDAATKNYYKQCASSPSQFYDAPTQTQLIDVFTTISKQLANLHISQ